MLPTVVKTTKEQTEKLEEMFRNGRSYTYVEYNWVQLAMAIPPELRARVSINAVESGEENGCVADVS